MATANAGSLRTLLTEKDKSGGNFIIPEGHQNAVINVGTKALEMYKTAAHVLKPVISLTPDVLDQLASIHPLVAVTVNVFKMVVALEMQRKDNQKKIKVLVDVMEDSMGELTFIKQGKVSDQVEPVLKKLSEQSRSFGVFVQSYVDMSRTVKVFQSSGIQTKLNGFAKSFADIKVELSHKLQLQNSVAISNQSEALARQEDRLDQIMRILEAKSAEERSAEQFFSRHGGIENCKNDNQLIQELAASFGETINKDVISSIHSGFEQILAANQAQFDRVLEQQTKEFSNINVKLDALLDMGPHKLIRHKVVAEIWKKNDFGGSVKGKLFIEALYTHYLLSVPPDDPDHWMVNLLSLTYAQSIIDSIDVDLTGHLNVHEVNTFFDAKPAYFSLMEWLVYSGLVIDYQRVKYINESQAIVFEDMKGLNDQFDEETKKMLQPYFKEVLPDITRSKAKGWDITKKSQFAEYRRLIDLMERREAHMLPKIQDLVDQIGRYQRRAFMPNDYYTYRDDVHAGAEGDRMLQEDDADDNLAFVFLFQRELLKRHVSILSAAAEDPENAKLILSPTTIKNMIQDIKSIAQVLMEQAIDLYLDAERMKVADPISFVKRAFGGSLFTWYLHYEKVKHRLGSDFRVEEELTADVDASEAEIQRKLMYGDGAAAEQPEILGRTGSILRTVKEFESGQTAKAKELDVEVNPRGHLRESRLMEMERSIASIFEMRMENIKRNGEERVC
ncbi:hypothetical protein BJ742DRAFT_3992 [Cladochytrium replicatum]|nr:hypothetical protein BJ742DRAFT_3992 [Cladochytrium replicatum]